MTSRLHLGLIEPGDRLPSARETAQELGADYRVVVAAYRELERDGLVEVRPRSGVFVAAGASRPDAALPRFGQRVVDLLAEEVTRGRPAPDFPERVRRCLETLRLRAACIECNDDQLSALRYELEVDYGLEAACIEVDELESGGRAPRAVRQADLLVSTSFHAPEVQRVATALDKPCVIVTLDPDFRAELARLMIERPVYFVGTDPRFADKLRVLFREETAAANLRPLIVGRDRLEEIPEGAPVVLTPASRARLAGTGLLQRALPPRGFSRESARQILTFVVRANVAAMMAIDGSGGSAPG